MPYFAYSGRSDHGNLVNGVLESADKDACAQQLLSSGITPVDIRPAAGPTSTSGGGWQRLFQPRVGDIDLMLFSRQMHTLLKAGVPILRGLAGLKESTNNPTFAAVLGEILSDLDSGREFSVAMRRHSQVFSSFYLSMVRVGEMTGGLDVIFLYLFDHLEFEKRTRDQIKSALRYPGFVILAMGVAITIINIFVIPTFAKVYAAMHTELPPITQWLIAFSTFTVKFWPLILVIIVGMLILLKSYIRTVPGQLRWDTIKLRIPIIGDIIEKATLARFARSFSLAAKSGVPIIQALGVVALTVDNAFISQRIEQMREGIGRGETILRTATAVGIFTPMVLQMIAVGEETGELDNLMQEVAEMYDREVEYEVKNLSDRIEPILLVGLGILVMILALGVFLPLWNLGQAAMHH
ncbi:MSHA biogenesis protein MshG [Gammaproteobacteria bacterium]